MRQEEKTQTLDRACFAVAWRRIGATHDNASAWLASQYAEEHRAYHNAEHIAECLAWSDRVRDECERPAEVEVALFFHDAIYQPLATDNEARSAESFRILAEEAGVPLEAIQRVAAMIQSTATHDCTSTDAALLNDIDLAVLAASPSRFARYERDIRREYAAVDDASYRAGRTRVLRGFLERLEIYRTPWFAARLEAQARDNLRGALLALEPFNKGGDYARIH